MIKKIKKKKEETSLTSCSHMRTQKLGQRLAATHCEWDLVLRPSATHRDLKGTQRLNFMKMSSDTM